MIPRWLVATLSIAMLAACSPYSRPTPPGGSSSGSGISLSGTAVSGVTGGSGQTTQMVTGVKDLNLHIGVALDGN